jgi:hypothetical protein
MLLLFLPLAASWLLSEYSLERVNLLSCSPEVTQTQPNEYNGVRYADELIATTSSWHLTVQHEVLLNNRSLYTLPYAQLADGILAIINTTAYTLAQHQGQQLLLTLDYDNYAAQAVASVDGLLVYAERLLAVSNGRLLDLETQQVLWQSDRLPSAGNAFRNCINNGQQKWPSGTGAPLAEYCTVGTVGFGTEAFVNPVLIVDSSLSLQIGWPVQRFDAVQLRGQLSLDLSRVDVVDGATFTLFSYATLSGTFDEIALTGYTPDCGRVEAEADYSNGEVRVTLRVLTDSCYSAGFSIKIL